VEQKNGMLIRRVVGYERLVGLEAAQLLAELYAALRLFTNLFQPSFNSKAAFGRAAGSSGSTTRREHRCSGSCAPECSAIRRPRASGSSESGVTR
jgi:hypothetical protein